MSKHPIRLPGYGAPFSQHALTQYSEGHENHSISSPERDEHKQSHHNSSRDAHGDNAGENSNSLVLDCHSVYEDPRLGGHKHSDIDKDINSTVNQYYKKVKNILPVDKAKKAPLKGNLVNLSKPR